MAIVLLDAETCGMEPKESSTIFQDLNNNGHKILPSNHKVSRTCYWDTTGPVVPASQSHWILLTKARNSEYQRILQGVVIYIYTRGRKDSTLIPNHSEL